MTAPSPFADRSDIEAIETGTEFAPKFGPDGLILAVAADAANGDVLMVAHMNAEALKRTLESGEAWFWSRSRKALWRKGETSGNTLKVVELRVDCDQDALLLKVQIAGDGVACHRGFLSCFYRTVALGGPSNGIVKLTFDGEMRQESGSR